MERTVKIVAWVVVLFSLLVIITFLVPEGSETPALRPDAGDATPAREPDAAVEAEPEPEAVQTEPRPPAELATPVEVPGEPNRANFDAIEEGMTENAVAALLGPPTKVDPDEPGGTVEKDWYAGHMVQDGTRYSVEITINFRDGQVLSKQWDLDPPRDQFHWPAK